MEKTKLTIADIRSRVQSGDSARDVAEECLSAIHARDNDIHAFLEVYEDDILKEADAIDARIQAGEDGGPLGGVPIAVKDNILCKGKHASAASHILESYVASYDATVIKKLKAAGALIIGRTNMDEFAMGSSTENSAFGVTRNPHDLQRVPGGSSGGSASAVAAGECAAALGSDTGGSIRQPSAFCGVVGLKPTYGAVSRHGLIAMASSLDQIGPLTKTVEDAEIIFNVIKGKDVFDSTTAESGGRNYELQKKENIRIGVPKEYFTNGLDPEVEASVKRAISMLRDSGCAVQEISLPHTDYALACYYIIMPAEVSANLARFDGIRYGFSSAGESLLDVYTETRHKGFGPEVRRRVLLGTHVLSAGYYDAYYTKAQKVRARIRKEFEEAFLRVDVIVSPTTPTPAFGLGEKTNDPLAMYLEDVYTVPANIAGIPALSMPCGSTQSGLPIGVQFMGRWFEEETLFHVGKQLEKAME